MNDDELLPPLPASAEALLRSERGRPGIPDRARQRIAHRLEWAVGPTAPAKLESVDELAGWRTRWALFGRAFRAAAASIAVLGPVPLAVAGVGVGSVVGLGLRALIVTHQEPVSHPAVRVPGSAPTARPPFVIAPLRDLPSPPPLAPAELSPEAFPQVPPKHQDVRAQPPSAAVPAVQPPQAPQPPQATDVNEVPPAPTPAALPQHRSPPLATEGVLLDRARTALSRGNAAEALDRIAEHRMGYPESQLAEERELLSVEAELAAGNVGEARFRAEEFQRRFPHSLLLPRVQAALSRLH